MTNTTQFAIFPFEHKGYKFISKVAETSRFLPQIIAIKDEFIAMNKGAVDECMPDLEDMSWASIEKQVAFINEGGSEMFLELVGVA
jgi:hypothetical protein